LNYYYEKEVTSFLPPNFNKHLWFKLSTINKYIIKLAINNKNLPLIESIGLIIKTSLDLSISQLAKKAGVSPQAAYADIKGGKKCPRFRKKIKEVLGYIPWAN